MHIFTLTEKEVIEIFIKGFKCSTEMFNGELVDSDSNACAILYHKFIYSEDKSPIDVLNEYLDKVKGKK